MTPQPRGAPPDYAQLMSYRFDLDDAAVRRVMDEAGRAAMDRAEAAARGARCPEHGQAPEIKDRDPRTHEFSLDPSCCSRSVDEGYEAIQRALS
jgi:hypothetical protein